MPEYDIHIVRPQIAGGNLQPRFLHLITGLLLLLVGLDFSHRPQFLIPAVCLLVFGLADILLAAFFGRISAVFPRAGLQSRKGAPVLFLIAAILDYSQHDIRSAIVLAILALAFLLVYFLEKRRSSAYSAHFNEAGVSVPTFTGNRFYSWNLLNQVILRNGLLTLDFSDNRLMQVEIATPLEDGEIADFNAWCEKKIAGVRSINQ